MHGNSGVPGSVDASSDGRLLGDQPPQLTKAKGCLSHISESKKTILLNVINFVELKCVEYHKICIYRCCKKTRYSANFHSYLQPLTMLNVTAHLFLCAITVITIPINISHGQTNDE